MRGSHWLAVAGILLWLAACGDSGPMAPGDGGLGPDTPEDPAPNPNGRLLCEVIGYACNAADISDAALERSQVLFVDLKQRVESGVPKDEAAAWLAAQADVRHVEVSPSAIVFLVRGGVPFWLMTPDRTTAAQLPEPLPPIALDGVVGHGTPREDKVNQKKKALVLSPFLFEFGVADPSPVVVARLSSIRDYQGGAASPGVTWRSNDTQPRILPGEYTAGDVTVDDFLGWSHFDVIFLHSHGGTTGPQSVFCRQGLCKAAVLSGERVADCIMVKNLYPTRVGLGCGGAQGADGIFITVSSDFFTQEYTGFNPPIEGAIVFFNSCQSYQSDSFAITLGGPRNAFFGWDGVFDAHLARPTVTRFFQLLADQDLGLSTGPAYEKIKAEGLGVAGGVTLVRDSRGRPDGLHIREITTLKSPVSAGASPAPITFHPSASASPIAAAPGDMELEEGAILPFLGQAEDGENDELFFFVDVDGVEAGSESRFSVRIEVNDSEVGTWSLSGPHASRVGDYTVRVKVRQPVDFDVQRGQSVKLKAVTILPDEGESPHEVNVVLRNPTLHFHSIIETSGGDVGMKSTVQAEVELAFKAGADTNNLEIDSSVGPLEYVKFEAVLPECTPITTTFDGRIGIGPSNEPFLESSTGEVRVPDELLLIVYPEIRERLTISCGGFGQTSLDLIHWFAGFVSFHGGELGGPNEIDESRGGFVIRGWGPGGEGAFARRVYQRTATEDEVTLSEHTTIEIRGPAYAP